MDSNRLVAPITTTSLRPSKPSIRASSVDTMELRDTLRQHVSDTSVTRQRPPFSRPVVLSRPVDLVLSAGPDRSQAVNLIEEDDGGTHLIRLRTTHGDT